ncbi:MAG: alpha/beta fold hydrolase [Candidatus Aureabacteria bacterium]|nr:alpha/beta fold hydrolase [Candidatus Auribacterota bacterium]
MEFLNEGQRIFGTIHVPEPPYAPPFPAMVMLHGFTGNRMEPHQLFVKASRRCAGEGIAVLRFDFRGCGESEGLFENLSIAGEIGDTVAALNLLRGRPDVDDSRIGILGFSLGGAIAACVAARVSGVSCLMLWSAVADLKTAFRAKAPEEIVRGFGKREIHDFYGNALSQKLLDELLVFNPAEHARLYRGPALIIHGSADTSVAPGDAVCYREALGNRPDVEMHIIPGANHTFASLAGEGELLETTTRFLKRHLV